jgi:hypothetical protein
MHDHHDHHGHNHREHEHSHEHNHHEHDHDHEHNHNEHDHDHHGHNHHEHNHDHDENISIDEHEGALVASLSLSFTGDFNEAERTLAAELELLARTIEERGGAVGHIKASLFGGGVVSTLSTTGTATGTAVSRGDNPRVRAEVVAIVLSLSAEELREALAVLLQ